MGKGDKKTRRGKIFTGSYGKHRPRKAKGSASAITKKDETVKEKIKVEEADLIEKKPIELKTEKKPIEVKAVKKPKEEKAIKKPKETRKTKTEPKKSSTKKTTKKKPDKEK